MTHRNWFVYASCALAGALLLLALGILPVAHASEDELPPAGSPERAALEAWAEEEARWLEENAAGVFADRSQAPPTPLEKFLRAEAVLRHFGVPVEPESQPLVSHLDGNQDPEGLRRVLPFLDRDGVFARFFRVASTGLEAFQDRDSLERADFGIRFRAPASRAVGRSGLPLEGLRIALDPGHMGGDEWDEITGKFIRDKDGTKLSEGVMALQVTLLLRSELEALGAEVMITRYENGSVLGVPYKELELTDYAHYELQESVYQDWFQALVARAPVGPQLFRLFEQSPQLRKVYSEAMRWKYYVHRADLWARVRAMREFDPHLALVVHFDISTAPNDPHGVNPALKKNMTKAYVPGAFFGEELASREDRVHFGRHAMDPRAWLGSVRLSRAIAHSFRDRMGLPLQTAHSDNAIKVEDGVFARNLVLSRMLTGIPVSYLECLFYNERREFDRLKRRDHRLVIGGEETWYSSRLLEVVHSIREGVREFASSGEKAAPAL